MQTATMKSPAAILTEPSQEMSLYEQSKKALHDITRGRLEISERFFNTQIYHLEKN